MITFPLDLELNENKDILLNSIWISFWCLAWLNDSWMEAEKLEHDEYAALEPTLPQIKVFTITNTFLKQ